MNFDEIQDILERGASEYQAVKTTCDELEAKQTHIKKEIVAWSKAMEIAQAAAEGVQKKVHDRIATIVSIGLSTVFDNPYTFLIQFEKKRTKTEAHLLFARAGEVIDPISSAGGGAIDVAAFALRLSAILMDAGKRPMIVMDEPFKFVSKDRVSLVCDLLETLAREKGVKILLTTHIENFEIGKEFIL